MSVFYLYDYVVYILLPILFNLIKPIILLVRIIKFLYTSYY
jgi:hypothetical protein